MRRPTVIGLALAGILWGCAARPRVEETPPVSPTGVTFRPGTPPVPTRSSQTAILFLRQDRPSRALELLLDGIDNDPGNPIHHFLAGVTYARLGRYVDADRAFDEAERIYPAYELQTELEREAAWGAAFNEGLDAYDSGDTDRAIELWQAATALYDLRSEAHRNLANLLTAERRYAEAIAVYRAAMDGLTRRPVTRRLTPAEVRQRGEERLELEESLAELLLATERFTEAEPLLRERLARDPTDPRRRLDLAAALTGQGRDAEADAIYSTVLSDEGLEADQLYSVGVALFRSESYAEAARAFGRLTDLTPRSRDAWFNYANALFAAEEWEELAAMGERLVAADPLGESSGLLVARARLETHDREAALRALDQLSRAPVYLEGLQLRRTGARTTLVGKIAGNAAEPGTPVRIRFSFYTDAGALLGSETLTVLAPAAGASRALEVVFDAPATGYAYRLVS